MTLRNTEWEIFFDLLLRVVSETPGSWQEKKAVLLAQAREYDAEVDLEELVGWFKE